MIGTIVPGCSTKQQAPGVFTSGSTASSNGSAGPIRVSREQLQGNLMAFADRFLARISQATDSIEACTTDPKMRSMAHSAKYYPSLAVITTAADPDTEVALLDIVAMVTLERGVWAGGWAQEEFGPLSADLLKAHEELEADAWSMASKVLSTEQLAALRSVIDGWRAEHPDQKYVATVRFDDFMLLRNMDLRRRSTLIKVNLVITDTDAAAAEIRKSRLFAERALFLAGRMPMLMSWQAEMFAYDLALSPEVRLSLDTAATVSESVQRLSEDVRALPERVDAQMKSTLATLDEREHAFNAAVANLRDGLTQAETVAGKVDDVALSLKDVASETTLAANALNEVVRGADALASRFERPDGAASHPDARPFDIREYTLALSELTAAARELNTLVQQSNTMLQSPAWQARVSEIDDAAGKRIEQVDHISREWVVQLDERAAKFTDRLTMRGVLLIAIGCAGAIVAALVYRLLTRGR